MKKKHTKHREERPSIGFDHISSSTEFYSASPVERPLSAGSEASDSHHVHQTERHHAALGRRPERMDPREKLALLAILKSIILLLVLMIAFFMLWKGISLYEESIWLGHADIPDQSPVLQEVELVEGFDIQNQGSREQFAKRIELWKEADRLVRSADVLLQRNIYDQAIEQCQDALRRDPAHLGALERLGRLYSAKGSHVEAVNAYIRLLSVDPSKKKTQKQLIEALAAFGDYAAVQYMAEWYFEQNTYDVDVHRYLAQAHYAQEDFAAAAAAYGQVLRESPVDIQAMEQQAAAYMQVRQYEKALVPLAKLREINLQNPVYYKQIAICNAQLPDGQETVRTLERAVQLFGRQMVLGLLADPQLDPVRENRAFQAFTDRVGGKEFRLGIEELAWSKENEEKERREIEPQLEMPLSESQDAAVLELGELQ